MAVTFAGLRATLAESPAWDRTAAAPRATGAPDPQELWGNFRSSWTSTDEVRTTSASRPAPAPAPASPPTPPGVWQTSGGTTYRPPASGGLEGYRSQGLPAMSAPEAVIRAGLQPLLPPQPTAGSVLRGSAQPRPKTAAGIARMAPPPLVDSPGTAVAPLSHGQPEDRDWGAPIDVAEPHRRWPEVESRAARHAFLEQERTYPLFDVPTDAAARIDRQAAERVGTLFFAPEYPPAADADADAVAWSSQPLIVPQAPPYRAPEWPTDDGLAPGLATANLDGLDGLAPQGPPERSPFEPVPLNQIRPYHDYSPEGIALCPDPEVRCPEFRPLPSSTNVAERYYPHVDFLWVPTNVFYAPLYFEDPALERYGHTHGLLQPLASPSRFALQFVSLPYQMALDPPHRRVYPLGFYRPGECAPKQVPNIPLNAEAAVKAGAVYTGLIFAFP